MRPGPDLQCRQRLGPEAQPRRDLDRPAVAPLHLLRRRQEKRHQRAEALQRHKHRVRVDTNAAGAVGLDVEGEVDRAANDGPELVQDQPDRNAPPAPLRLGVGDRHPALGRPEDAGRQPAHDRADDQAPLRAELGVGVQAGGVGRVAEGADDEGPLGADLGDDRGAEEAGEDHDGEQDRVGRVGGARRGEAAGAEVGERAPAGDGGQKRQWQDRGSASETPLALPSQAALTVRGR